MFPFLKETLNRRTLQTALDRPIPSLTAPRFDRLPMAFANQRNLLFDR